MRVVAALAGAVALATDGLYLWVLHAQGSGDGTLRPVFVASLIAVAAVSALLSTLGPQRLQAVLMGFAGAALFALGVLAIFSIGLLLLVAAALLLIGWVDALTRDPAPHRFLAPTVGGAALAVVLLFAGFYATDLPVRCPSANAQGGGDTLFHGSYSFTCEDGRIQFR